ncbi:MAG: hypothetical protein AAGD14_12625 [Planctomycetota bacterium]
MRITLGLALIAGAAWAQESPAGKESPGLVEEVSADKPAPKQTDEKALATKEKVRVLKPQEVAGELLRLKTKADIKADIRIKNAPGRPAIVFKGVIRNGKLIERLVDRRFVPQKDVAHGRSGVRLWWSGNSDGYIFFRYSSIESVTITGKLTAKERAEILRRLRAGKSKQDEAKQAAAAAEKKQLDLEKLTPAEREAYLMNKFPAEKGWTAHRYRELKKKEIVEEVKLPADESLFVKYYRVLERARYRNLKISTTDKEKFEPGSADRKQGEQGDVVREREVPAAEDE